MVATVTTNMADRRKLTAESVESDRQFLDKSGVSVQIKDLLTQLIENRPEDPIDFICEFFDNTGDKTDCITKAVRQINHSHYSRPAYQKNVRIAYDILSNNKGGSRVKGITGSTHLELMNSLTKPLPAPVKDKLMKKMSCREHEVITFDLFQSLVFICSVLLDFIKTAKDLYRELDPKGSNKLDTVICNVIAHQLKEAVIRTTDNPTSLLEAGYMLAPDRMYSALATAMFRGATNGTTSCDDFVCNLADIFLLKTCDVPTLHLDNLLNSSGFMGRKDDRFS